MKAHRFDAIGRAIPSSTSRRAILGAFLGSGILGAAAESSAESGRRRRKRQRGGRVATEATCASPGPSANLSGCSFNNQDLTGSDLSSSNLRNAKFRGANLCGADLSSSQLKNADFRGFAAPGNVTNLFAADLSSSGCSGAQFNARTVFCNTRTCSGSISNRDCPGGVDPRRVCCVDANCGPGGLCQDGVCCTSDVRAAVAAATSGATINVCEGAFLTRGVLIASDLTIIGAGAASTILDAQDVDRVFQIGLGAVVELRDLTITGGNVFGNLDGGGLLNQGSLTLRRVTVRRNRASGAGGGISNIVGSTLVLGDGTRVENNRAAGNGGGINNGGALAVQAGSRIENNLADDGGLGFGDGGGIFNSATGTVTLEPGSVVSNNNPDNCDPDIGTCS